MFGTAGRLVSRAQAVTSRAALFFLVVALCTASIPAVAVSPTVENAERVPVAQVATPVPSNETTNETADATGLRHRDPATVNEAGNVTELESHLAELLASRLGDSVVQIEREQYDQARSLVGPEYNSVLSRYVSVSRERRGESESRFGQAGRTQRAFVDSVAEYQEKRAAYQEAKQRGDEERARELARDLNEAADRSQTTRDRLVDDYTTIERDTGLDFTTELSRVETLTREIETQQAQIRDVEFFATTLTLTETSPSGSFEEPIIIRGRVASPEATSEPFGAATFVVGDQAYPTAVTDAGAFAFAYRPTSVPVGEQTLNVAFRPRNDSVYLGSNTTMTVTVQQSSPTVTIETSPATTAFGNEYRVAGRLAVGDVPVPETNVTLWMGGTPLNVTQTDSTGAVRFTGLLPAAVPAGEQTVRLGLTGDGRALAPAVTEAPVTVETTGTVIDLDADPQALEAVAVSGTLVTATGELVVRQPVDIRFDGTAVGTAVTDRNGEFAAVLWIPPGLGTGRSLTVEAVFDGSGKNLATSRDADTLALSRRGSVGAGDEPVGLQSSFAGLLGIDVATLGDGVFAALLAVVLGAPLWSGGVALVCLVVAGVLAWQRRPDAGGVLEDPVEAVPATEPDVPVAVERVPALLLDIARDRLAAGEPVEAVEYSYLTARLWFVHARGVPKRGTHREFRDRVSADRTVAESEQARLGIVTTQYERAVFSPTPPTEEDATHTLDVSASLLR